MTRRRRATDPVAVPFAIGLFVVMLVLGDDLFERLVYAPAVRVLRGGR